MAKKNKKTEFVISALKYLNKFSETDVGDFDLSKKQPQEIDEILKLYHLQKKKESLLKRITLNNITFETDKIINCTDIKILSNFEQIILLEIRKFKLFGIINAKNIPVSKEMIEKISLSTNINELNKIVENFPNSIKIELGTFKYRRSGSTFSSVKAIYTPMGNKR